MNVDIINNSSPHWWWVIALGVVLSILAMLGWGLLKIIRVSISEQIIWLLDVMSCAANEENAQTDEKWHKDIPIVQKLVGSSGGFRRGWQKKVGRLSYDLGSEENSELEETASGTYEFKPPPRRWTKLKEL